MFVWPLKCLYGHWNVCMTTEMFVWPLKCCYYSHWHRLTANTHLYLLSCILHLHCTPSPHKSITLQSTWYHGSILPMIANRSEYVKMHFQCSGVLLKSKAWLYRGGISALIRGGPCSIYHQCRLQEIKTSNNWQKQFYDQTNLNFTTVALTQRCSVGFPD